MKLSVFDVLGILLALEDTKGEVPAVPALDHPPSGGGFRQEDGPYGPLPAVPPDWIVDGHTWNGGPPSSGARQPAPKPPSPITALPPRSKDWHTWPVRPSKPYPREDIWNGVLPTDKPVGKYPGWDKPHPGEWPQRFRCGGQVWEGYRSDCPDLQPKPIDERWKTPLGDVARDMVNNARHTLELIRADPHCVTICKGAVALPALISGVCLASERFLGAVPSPYAKAVLSSCEIFRAFKDPIVVGVGLGAAQFGPDWCKETFCRPPSDSIQRRAR